MKNPPWLLPRFFRFIGIILTFAGIVMTILRFWVGIKPDFLEMKVFVLYSAYLETHEFALITNNISEEICGIVLLLGLFFMAFSKMRTESDEIWNIRTRALIWSFYTNTIFLIFCFILIYGWGFLMVMTLNLVLYLVLYNIFFYFLFLRSEIKHEDE